MTCFHPISIWIPTKADTQCCSWDYYASKKPKFKPDTTRQELKIPCGHCLGCKLDHANMWATRIMLEAKSWKNNCVISLTYNDPHIHINEESGLYTLKKKDLQDFMKRLRHHEKGIEKWIHPLKDEEEQPIRYFACGEYGRSGTRAIHGGNPHFHVIFFNWKPDDLKLYKMNKYGDPIYTSKKLQDIWGNGFVTVEDLNYNTACYVARYVQKKAGIAPIKREYEENFGKPRYRIDERNGTIFLSGYKRTIKKPKQDQEPEFIVMSRGVGIGVTEWTINKEKIKRNKGILMKINGIVKLKPIPRYFKKLWESENYEEYYRFKYIVEQDQIKKKAEIISMLTLPDGTTEETAWEFYLETQEKILVDKAKHLKRNNFV